MNVDVVIPAYNSAEWLEDAIGSVLKQTVGATKIIVVDDASSDDTGNVLARYGSRVQRIRHASNLGISAARNSGIRASTSDLIAFLDADDAWTPHKLETQLADFAGNNPPGLSYTGLMHCDIKLQPTGSVRRFRKRTRERVFSELFVDAFPIPPSTVMARRCVFDTCGLFDESMPKAEDFECWLRIAMKYTVSCIPGALCYRRNNPNSITAQSGLEKDLLYGFRAFELCEKAARENGIPLPMSVQERKVLFLKRRYRESLLWNQCEGASFYKQKIVQQGAYSPLDRLMAAGLKLRAQLSRVKNHLLHGSGAGD